MTESRLSVTVLVLALVTALTGCTPPPLARPEPPLPAAFPQTGESPTPVPAWRDFYREPALQQLIEAALAHNRDLRVAAARVEEARALAGLARADRLPTLEAQTSANRTRLPRDLSGTGTSRIADRYDVGLGMTAFELDFWGRLAALDEAARAQYLASEEAQRAFRVGLIGEVALAWYQLGELAERQRLAEETLKNRSASLALLTKRREVGLASALEVLAAQGLVESVRGQLAELRRQRAQVENALALLTAHAVPLPPPLLTPQAMRLTPGLPSETLLARPDVGAAEQRLLAAHANVVAARAAFFPRIVLTASIGTASAALSGLFDASSGAWLFQPVLRLPLFDSGRLEGGLDLAEARKVAAVADYERTVQQAFREVADALAARAAYAEEAQALERVLAAQRARLARVEARQRAGLGSYLEVLDAARDTFAAEQALVTARRLLLSSEAVLYKALGGGAQ